MADGPLVGILMGSQSDSEVMDEAGKELEARGISYEVNVISAHRNPEKVREYSMSAESRGLKVIIAGAGKAAALPGVVASMTELPVIGVPIRTSDLGGLDSLLSMVQMPSGVPVATVAINGAQNAAILAAKILRVTGPGFTDLGVTDSGASRNVASGRGGSSGGPSPAEAARRWAEGGLSGAAGSSTEGREP